MEVVGTVEEIAFDVPLHLSYLSLFTIYVAFQTRPPFSGVLFCVKPGSFYRVCRF